jgi:hypothetical protein
MLILFIICRQRIYTYTHMRLFTNIKNSMYTRRRSDWREILSIIHTSEYNYVQLAQRFPKIFILGWNLTKWEVSLCCREEWRERESWKADDGRGDGSLIIRRKEYTVLYETFNTLWVGQSLHLLIRAILDHMIIVQGVHCYAVPPLHHLPALHPPAMASLCFSHRNIFSLFLRDNSLSVFKETVASDKICLRVIMAGHSGKALVSTVHMQNVRSAL